MENNTYQSMEHHQNESELKRHNQPAGLQHEALKAELPKPKRALDTGRRPSPKPASYATPKGNGKNLLIGAIVAVVAGAVLYVGYNMYANKPQHVAPPAVQRDTKQDQAQEIYSVLEKDKRFGEFVKADAIEYFDYFPGESDLTSWRGKNIYPLKSGFIDVGKLTGAFTDALQPDTLEINHNRTKFQADIAGTSGFSAKSLIESSVSDVSSLKPENANYTNIRDIPGPGQIYDRIKYSGSQDSYGYICFFLKTDNNNVLIMAAFSIDPYAALQPKSYIVLSSGFIPYDSRTLREIEDRINVRDDINAVEFTMKSGNVESNDDLTECLRKFINSFAK